MKLWTGVAAAALGFAASTLQAAPVVDKADKAIEYRQGVYGAMEWNLNRMAAMVQGRVEFDAADFAERAERLALLGTLTDEGFGDANSVRGEAVNTRASYRIWEARERFDGLMAEMQTRTRTLQQAAAAGQARDELRPLMGRVAQSCKACHDKFRD